MKVSSYSWLITANVLVGLFSKRQVISTHKIETAKFRNQCILYCHILSDITGYQWNFLVYPRSLYAWLLELRFDVIAT